MSRIDTTTYSFDVDGSLPIDVQFIALLSQVVTLFTKGSIVTTAGLRDLNPDQFRAVIQWFTARYDFWTGKEEKESP